VKTVVFPESAEAKSIATDFQYDQWLVDRFLHYVPNIDSFVRKMEFPPAKYIRANTLKSPTIEVNAALAKRGFTLEQTKLSEMLRVVNEPINVGATIEYMQGLYYIQDLSSAMAVEALEPKPNEHILDLAAAPGGKTSHIAQRMENTGAIIALEPNSRRARSMSFNIQRMGVLNTCICRLEGTDALFQDARFDRVLLDAPCSCEGIIAKDARRKTSHTPADIEYCSNRQEQLITAACKAVRHGGTLIYSTCSFAPEENEMVVDSLIQHNPTLTIEPLEFGNPGLTKFGDFQFDNSLRNTRRFYPHIHDTTGFFIAKLRVK